MFDPLDLNIRAKSGLENGELRSAQSLAMARSGADRAMIFDQHKWTVRFFRPFGHVSFALADRRKLANPCFSRLTL